MNRFEAAQHAVVKAAEKIVGPACLSCGRLSLPSNLGAWACYNCGNRFGLLDLNAVVIELREALQLLQGVRTEVHERIGCRKCGGTGFVPGLDAKPGRLLGTLRTETCQIPCDGLCNARPIGAQVGVQGFRDNGDGTCSLDMLDGRSQYRDYDVTCTLPFGHEQIYTNGNEHAGPIGGPFGVWRWRS